MTPLLLALAIFVLASVCAGGVLYALSPADGEDLFGERINKIAGVRTLQGESDATANRDRIKTVEKTLRELEERNRSKGNKGKLTLVRRMRQGGLAWSKRTYYTVCAATGFSVFVFLFPWIGPVQAAGFAVAGGAFLPHLVVKIKRQRRLKAFSREFPNAVDVVVRGLKSGLPLADCMKIIAAESQEPVRSEFKTVVQDLTLGLPLDEAVGRMSDRVPLSETGFFSIVVTTQSKTGGSLSEALSNLSGVLRDRKRMEGKIRAMSSEARTSSIIIGTLPVVVGTVVWFTSPEYISLLFNTGTGKLALAFSLVWMTAGIFVMHKMTNFDY